MSIKVTLRIPENRQRSVTLPDDIPLSRLVPALANKLKMPFTDQGQTITYNLYHENSQTIIAPHLTLAEAGIQPGDTVVLQETHGETAVAEPILKAAQEETKAKPVPKKKGMSTTIKVIIGVFILLILCVCATPFFFMYTAFSQFFTNAPGAFPLSDITNRLDSGIKPEVVWQFPVADTIMEAPAVDNGVVYFGVLSSDSPDFYALDAATGEALWQFTADDAIAWTPALTQDKVFFSTDGGIFYALDRTTGIEQWRFTPEQRNLDTGPDCDFCALKFRYPVVAGNTVYVGSLDDHLYALDAATGAEKWRFSTQGSVLDKPAITDGIVYFGTGEGLFYAVDAETGDQIYRVRTANENTQKLYDPVAVSGPIVEENRVYITNGGAAALDRHTGEKIWRFISPNEWGYISKRPLADDQHIYVMNRQVTIYALDKNDGSVVWTYDYPDDYIYGEMVLDNGLIYFGAGNGRLVTIDAQTGKPYTIYNLNKHQSISSYEVSDTVFTPAIDSGTAYLGWANQMNAIQLDTP